MTHVSLIGLRLVRNWHANRDKNGETGNDRHTTSGSIREFVSVGRHCASPEHRQQRPAGAAQTAQGDGGETDIVVTGIRQSLRLSIDAKRDSSVIADVLSAEDIGKFPDKNVAEALQRVPGVVINREFGEGERVRCAALRRT